jgi:hypothetical protein
MKPILTTKTIPNEDEKGQEKHHVLLKRRDCTRKECASIRALWKKKIMKIKDSSFAFTKALPRVSE